MDQNPAPRFSSTRQANAQMIFARMVLIMSEHHPQEWAVRDQLVVQVIVAHGPCLNASPVSQDDPSANRHAAPSHGRLSDCGQRGTRRGVEPFKTEMRAADDPD